MKKFFKRFLEANRLGLFCFLFFYLEEMKEKEKKRETGGRGFELLTVRKVCVVFSRPANVNILVV